MVRRFGRRARDAVAVLARTFRRGFPGAVVLGRDILWSRTFGGLMGRLLGALSLVALAHHAMNFGLSDTAREILHYYNRAVGIALGWLDPYLQALATQFLAIFRLEVSLSPIWRHVFLLLWILFARDAGVAFLDKRPVTGAFRLVIGIAIAVVIAIVVASLGDPLADRVQNIAIGLLPTVGIYIYDLALYVAAIFQIEYLNKKDATPSRTRREFLSEGAGRATRRLGLGLIISILALLMPIVSEMSAPAGGLLAFGAATIGNAAYWLWRGARFASNATRQGENWYDAFKRSEAGRFGMAITSVFVWMMVFVVLNVGMQTLGF